MRQLVDMGVGVRLERAVPCRMSDGVTLVADHYYPPPGGEPQPTLLMRQPYGRDIASTVVYAHPAWFARQGYNVVIQDVRGRGGSEGEFYPFRNEGRDGAETIAAVRARPESNGRVGMYGFSYQGMTQLLAAAEQPEGLQCIAPAMTAHDLYRGWFYEGGALRLASSLGWGLQMLREDARRLRLREASARLESAWASLAAQYGAAPYGTHPAIGAEGLPSYVRDWFAHDAPGDYWSAMDVSERVARVEAPALHVSGWCDTYLSGSIRGFEALRAGAGTEHARRHQYLLAGPWMHIPWGDRAGTHRLGAAAALDTDALLVRWFNHWLKDAETFAEEPAIRHFAMNDGRWHRAECFPTAGITAFLRSLGRANSSKGDGRLSFESPEELSSGVSAERVASEPLAEQPPDVFVYDPEVPVLAPGGAANVPGPVDQAPSQSGNNVLVYTSAPLDAPLHVFGAAAVRLYCASSAEHADLVAKLVCVGAGGAAQFVCLGVQRSRSLFGGSHAADEVFLWEFALEPTSWVFAAGDCVRLEIASSAWPLFDRNPSTATAPRLAGPWEWGRSTQRIFHDRARPSSLLLPVIPYTAAAEESR